MFDLVRKYSVRSRLAAPVVAVTAALALTGPGAASAGAAPQLGERVTAAAPAAAAAPGVVAARPLIVTRFKVASEKPKNGNAVAKGVMRWKSKKAVRVVGTLNDICPADSEDARVRISAIYTKGSANSREFLDNRGCEASAKKFDVTFKGKRTIARVYVSICERYNTTAGGGLYAVSDCRERTYGNPQRG